MKISGISLSIDSAIISEVKHLNVLYSVGNLDASSFGFEDPSPCTYTNLTINRIEFIVPTTFTIEVGHSHIIKFTCGNQEIEGSFDIFSIGKINYPLDPHLIVRAKLVGPVTIKAI